MQIEIPESCLLLSIGVDLGVSPTPNVEACLRAQRLAIVDGANLNFEQRRELSAMARRFYVPAIAVVTDPHPSKRQLEGEGFRPVWIVDSTSPVELLRKPDASDLRDLQGPFDLIGDVHGCFEELVDLLTMLGYVEGRHPQGRKAVFVGDLVDRGPLVVEVLRLVRRMCAEGDALCVIGNHDWKLARWMMGHQVTVAHGLEQSVAEMQLVDAAERALLLEFLEALPCHLVLDAGALVVAHAGLREEMHGRSLGAGVRDFCLYGHPTGEKDEHGFPIRHNWAGEYRGKAMVVYGHTPMLEANWQNHTINIDTGCVFGGKLTALRYPERELVEVPARRVYAASRKLLAKEP